MGPLSDSGVRSDFTHPWVGQAERLACRERQPTQFPDGSPLYLQKKKMLWCLVRQEGVSRCVAPMLPCVRRLDAGQPMS